MYGIFDTLSVKPPEGKIIAPGYISVLDKLTIPELTDKDGCSLQAFFGGPVIIGHKQHWLRPIFFKGFNVHVIYVNCTPDNLDNPEITFMRDDDIGFKLSKTAIRDVDHASVMVRQCLSGNVMFPNVAQPLKNHPMSYDDFSHLSEILNLGTGPVRNLIGDISGNFPLLVSEKMAGIYKIREDKYEYKDRQIYVADFILENDPWNHYQVISENGVDFSLDNGSLGGTVVRIDSGCDSGQIYGDEACECREQLHEGIDAMLQEGGIIIHIPTQDGRGYGCATKMETEGLKAGLLMKTNQQNTPAMNTVEAARHLFGEHYDIRTFHGAGRILHALGLKSITLLTDNRTKIDQIISAGIEVGPKTIKVHKPSCAHHTAAKYDTPLYTG